MGGSSRSICLRRRAIDSRPASHPGQMNRRARSWTRSLCRPGISRSASVGVCIGKLRSSSRREAWRRQSSGGPSQTESEQPLWCQRLTRQATGRRSGGVQWRSCSCRTLLLTSRTRRRRWGITRCSWWISTLLTRERRRAGRSANYGDAGSASIRLSERSALGSRRSCLGWRRSRRKRHAPQRQTCLGSNNSGLRRHGAEGAWAGGGRRGVARPSSLLRTRRGSSGGGRGGPLRRNQGYGGHEPDA
mmetsp:Transcript_41001/g.85562  ORF Transcript_41001/g.85562 Transcript_41001/m.85562 type:complete len:246 (-) Transcript_41001:1196-1933(-)